MNYPSPFLASILDHHGNYDSKNEYFSLESTDNTEPFLRYSEDPLTKTKNHGTSLNKPKDGAQNNVRLLSPNPYLHCNVTDTEHVPHEMTPQKLKENLIQYTSSPLGIKEPAPQIARLTGQELRSKRFNRRQQDVMKLENDRVSERSLIPRCEGSDDENGSMAFDISESVARYVKDPLARNSESQKTTASRRLEAQKDNHNCRNFVKLEPEKNDDDFEDVFLANPACQGDSTVPTTDASRKKYYVDSNTLNPSIVVFKPKQDTSSSMVMNESHFLDSLDHSSSITSEGLGLSKEKRANISESGLSYFSYLGDDFNKSCGSRTVSSTQFIYSGIQRMTSVSSYAESSTRYISDVSSPSSNHSQLAAEFDGPDKLDQIIDYCSCMCCIKALFYHCTKDNDCDSTYEAKPCQCEQPSKDCLKRWGFLSVLTCFMPCMLFYAPLKGLQKAAKRTKRFFRRKRV